MTVLALLFIIIDIASKLAVSRYMSLNETITVINKFLNITYVHNTGVAWSMFSHNTILVLAISLFVIIGILLYIKNNNPQTLFEKFAYSLILGGALGNFINRVVWGYVIDFIDVKIFNYDYPIFNLADVFIVIGVFMLVIWTWRHENGNRSKRKLIFENR